MRTLLLLRGNVGSGKSTFIKQYKLEPYTLSSDNFRLLLGNPINSLDGSSYINQKINKKAWNMLYECLEERMKNGDFTIIDATHTTKASIKAYNKLVEKYKYTIFYLQFDTPLDKCKENNKNRETYKIVPENVLETMNTQLETEIISPNLAKRIYSIKEIENFYVDDITNKYKKIVVIGDIHSCYTPLKELMKDYSKNNLYIFLGDYLDRGIESYDTLKFMVYLSKQSNVILLEGNHEYRAIFNYLNGLTLPKQFEQFTLDDLKDYKDLRKDLSYLYRKLRQAYIFKNKDKTYICTHSGLPYVNKLLYLSTKEIINGIGNHSDYISLIYETNFKLGLCKNYTQIFGHRLDENTEHSINLEGQVEFGGHLKYIEIDNDNNIEYKQRKNNVYNTYRIIEYNKKYNTDNMCMNDILNNYLVQVKECDYNLYSVNFTRKAFRNKQWNDITIKARGLFVDRNTGKVMIRGYNKFFNYEESHTQNYINNNKLKYPIRVTRKENGFLGLMSVINNEIVLATKSTTNGEHIEYFKSIWNLESDETKNKFKTFMLNNKCSILFEVIHPFDPHIIEYNTSKLIMLDCIKNDIETTFVSDTIINNFLEKNGSEFRRITRVFKTDIIYNELELNEFIINNLDFAIEGFVLKDANNYMFKLKTTYYNKWKRIRNLVNFYKNNREKYTHKLCSNSFEKRFMEFIVNLPYEIIEKYNIIKLRNLFIKNS